MSNTQERALVIQLARSLSLAKDSKGSKSELVAATHLNAEVFKLFEIEGLLNDINDKLFRGKGSVSPLKHNHDIFPDDPMGGQSRFAKVFAFTGSISNVYSGTTLIIERKDFGVKEDKSSFDKLEISIGQQLQIADRSYSFFVTAFLKWPVPSRGSGGNWDSKPIFTAGISEGRVLNFSLQAVPSPKEISESLLKQVNEVIEELALKDLIPKTPVHPKP